MNDNNFKQQDLSRTLTEALIIAESALMSDAHSLKNSLEEDPKLKDGNVKVVIEQKMHETFEAAHVLRDTIKRRGHADVVKRVADHHPWLRTP